MVREHASCFISFHNFKEGGPSVITDFQVRLNYAQKKNSPRFESDSIP